MEPVTDNELVEIRCDFIKKLQSGNSDLKAAYLAVTERGFINMVDHTGDAVLMEREKDHKYVVCSHRIEYREPISESRQVIRFDGNIDIFKK
jgi:hypothetical protein